jgi:hypothetical protein
MLGGVRLDGVVDSAERRYNHWAGAEPLEGDPVGRAQILQRG